ncbi:YceI family protein [Candidatus Nitrotoga sp. M5]|uniref:YceI family protein n=1 Tax=Candidatus Nitrotoga sp. M5 TaxID=2890409 RepID=UPI001EF3E6FE|nr:YceI family protein [Candidatus Nitrotoga sp. M5]CAH1387888.1 Polyisoprenoid-binding protein YceI [Candidatus Nitrotoga sp. M5]
MLKRNIIAGLLMVSLPFAAHAADSYTMDPQHTYAHFSVSHLGFSTMQGRFDKTSGKVTLDRTKKSGSIDVTIGAASLTTGYDKRDAHLRSPDFFNVAEFPTLTFKSSAVKFKGDTPVSVEGKLTLLGVTKPVTLTIHSFKCGSHPMNKKELCGADASAQIKRSDFGMKYGLPSVGDDIKMVFEVEAYKD